MQHGMGLSEMFMVQGLAQKARQDPGKLKYEDDSIAHHKLVMQWKGDRKATVKADAMARSALSDSSEIAFIASSLNETGCITQYDWEFSMIEER